MADWGILQQTPNFGQAALSGFQAGQQLGKQRRVEQALSLYGTNPAAGVAALGSVDPVMATNLARAARETREYERADKLREGLTGAVNADGSIDPAKVRAAHLAVGDPEGALKFDAAQRTAHTEALKSAFEGVKMTNQLLAGAVDAPTYAAARQQAQRFGLDVSSVPEQYNLEWVQQHRLQGLDLEKQLDYELKRRAQDETRRHNVVGEGQGAARVGIAQGALKVAQRRAADAATAKGGAGDNSDLNYLMGGN